MVTPDSTPSVHCIILNLNGRELLLEALASIKDMTYPNFKMLVVDNGSTDGSQDAVRSQYPEVLLIENERNLGFGEGNNVGIRKALEQNADWVFLLNYDIIVAPDLLSQLMEATFAKPQAGILGPKIYYHSEPERIWYAGGKINFFTGMVSHRGIRKIDRGQYDKLEQTDYVTGCALLIKQEVLARIGMFDPVYFPAYSEDADLCVRANRAGYRNYFVPQARLWHKVSAFSGGGMTPLKTRLKVEHNLIFFKRYANWYHWLTIPLFIGAYSFVFIARELLKGNFRVITALLDGFGKALRRIF